MSEMRRTVLTQAGFYSQEPKNTGIECPLCGAKVYVTQRGYVYTHQSGLTQCQFSNTNHYERTIQIMRKKGWITTRSGPKRKKSKNQPKNGKSKHKGMSRQDRLIYATGHISISRGGLPTLGKGR